MRIDPTDPAPPKLAFTHQIQSFFVSCGCCLRQVLEIPQNIRAVFQVAARKLSQYERMHQNRCFIEKRRELRLAFTEMFNPDGGIDQHHHAVAERRRGTGSSRGSVPLNAARRFAASRAINASSPACTSAVFSSIPVRRLARSIRTSSIIKVVLICISMHQPCIQVKLPSPACVTPESIALRAVPDRPVPCDTPRSKPRKDPALSTRRLLSAPARAI
jgi:hypothetical protein